VPAGIDSSARPSFLFPGPFVIMICIQTPSRLHFGLFRVSASADRGEQPRRRFGGIGLMVAAPGVRLAAQPAERWSAEGPLAARTLAFARAFLVSYPPETFAPLRFVIEQAPPEHAGLGTGTQLGMAVARALVAAAGWTECNIADLARRLGRGTRSAIGIRGFEHGGFLVDAGKTAHEKVAPLAARFLFPEEWRLVLVTSLRQTGLHGAAERRAFQNLEGLGPGAEQTEMLYRLVLLDLLPSLAERDLASFGEALYEFNARVGETFASVQGGTYSSPQVSELVAFLRGRGIRGVGQSSWGPTVFAVLENEREANDLVVVLRRQFALQEAEIVVTRACNRGATVIV
jgi:beta-ribofuranosylaminobenzene 5'-phosphate synthase